MPSSPRCSRARAASMCSFARRSARDRKSTRLNSSHSQISYAVFCLKKKKDVPTPEHIRTAHIVFVPARGARADVAIPPPSLGASRLTPHHPLVSLLPSLICSSLLL